MIYNNFWFTSDLHFWHKNVIKFCNRPWPDVESMNAGLIKNWNDTVSDKDIIFILGDMFFCGTKKLVEIMKQLRGEKVLVRGNHDWGVIKPHRGPEFGFKEVIDQGVVSIGGVEVLLSHFPYAGDHTSDERYLDQRPKDGGLWLLHGHVHQAWSVKNRMINVGVDAWGYKPVNASKLAEIILSLEPSDPFLLNPRVTYVSDLPPK